MTNANVLIISASPDMHVGITHCNQPRLLIGCAPYTINLCARDAPEKLGFPVTLMGSRVRIPRIAFLRYITGNPYSTGEGLPSYEKQGQAQG